MLDPGSVLAALGREVRGRRQARGWSRRELALRTGISERFLADVETGRANPSVVKLCELAHALETAPATLLGGRTEPPGLPPRIALLGLRGAGKSSVGEALADRLGWPLVELDAEIEARAGISLEQIFELNGEAYFRRVERETLRALLDSGPAHCVLATGGGIVTDTETFALLQQHAWTVWLRARPEDHWRRVVAQGDTRPMRGQDAAFDALCRILRERERDYRQARLTIDTVDRRPTEIADELARRYAAAATAPVPPAVERPR
jgi:XRE family aerobic/anaerobic benzoate catabolism transcriptional regulator